jgi:hypothetical protein
MGEDVILVLNDYLKLHACIATDVKTELRQCRDAVAWSTLKILIGWSID